MEVQLKQKMLKPTDPITILRFLPKFQTAFDANAIQEAAEMWLFQNVFPKTRKEALSARLTAMVDHGKSKNGQLISYR